MTGYRQDETSNVPTPPYPQPPQPPGYPPQGAQGMPDIKIEIDSPDPYRPPAPTYPQPGYQQPPYQQPGYQQPGYPAPGQPQWGQPQPQQPGWVQPQQTYWAQGGEFATGPYGTNFLVIIAGIWLLIVGLLATLGGILVIAG